MTITALHVEEDELNKILSNFSTPQYRECSSFFFLFPGDGSCLCLIGSCGHSGYIQPGTFGVGGHRHGRPWWDMVECVGVGK